MEISTLKDLKQAMKDIPDEVLEKFGAGLDSEGNSDHVDLLCWDDEPHEAYGNATKKYPTLLDIDRWFRAIMQEEEKFQKDPDKDSLWERDLPISSSELNKND